MIFISNKFMLLGTHLRFHWFCFPPVLKKASELNCWEGPCLKATGFLNFLQVLLIRLPLDCDILLPVDFGGMGRVSITL